MHPRNPQQPGRYARLDEPRTTPGVRREPSTSAPGRRADAIVPTRTRPARLPAGPGPR